jgi:hypothetical protein
VSDLVALADQVDTTEPIYGTTVLAVPESYTLDEWAQLGAQLAAAATSVPWWIGDWLVFAHTHFELDGDGNTTSSGEAAVRRHLADLGFEHETVERHRRVAALFPPNLRHEKLTWTHHNEVAGLELEEAVDLLVAAADNRWSTRQLRDAVKAARAIEVTATDTTAEQVAHALVVRFRGDVAPVVAERLARGLEKTLRDLGVDGDVKVR